MKKSALILFTLWAGNAFGQIAASPLFHRFIYSYNPAAGALMDKKFTTGVGSVFEPRYSMAMERLGFDILFKETQNSALGVIYNGQTYGEGFLYSVYLGVQYSRAYKLNEKLKLSVGLQGEYVSKHNYSKKTPYSWAGYFLDYETYPNLNAGFMLKHERYYLGLTFQQILPWLSPLKRESFQTYLTGAYTFRVNPDLSFTPNVLAFTDYIRNKYQHFHYIQTNCMMNYKWVEIGPNLKYQYGYPVRFYGNLPFTYISFGGQVGVRIAKNILLGYAYEREEVMERDFNFNLHYFYLRFR